MEDAMIINKGAYERGFGHGSVYKTHMYDLDEEERRITKKDQPKPNLVFNNTLPRVADSNEVCYYCILCQCWCI